MSNEEHKLKTQVTTTFGADYTLTFVETGNTVRIDSTRIDCGMSFTGIATVKDPSSCNPGVLLNGALGVSLLSEICKLLMVTVYYNKEYDTYTYVRRGFDQKNNVGLDKLLTMKDIDKYYGRSQWSDGYEDEIFDEPLSIARIPQVIWDHIQTRV